jgi:hypothetical protein
MERKRIREEEERKKMREEQDRKRMMEEQERKRVREEQERKRIREEQDRKRMMEEQERKRLREEQDRKRMMEEQERKRMIEEQERKRIQEEELSRQSRLRQETEQQRLKEEKERQSREDQYREKEQERLWRVEMENRLRRQQEDDERERRQREVEEKARREAAFTRGPPPQYKLPYQQQNTETGSNSKQQTSWLPEPTSASHPGISSAAQNSSGGIRRSEAFGNKMPAWSGSSRPPVEELWNKEGPGPREDPHRGSLKNLKEMSKMFQQQQHHPSGHHQGYSGSDPQARGPPEAVEPPKNFAFPPPPFISGRDKDYDYDRRF